MANVDAAESAENEVMAGAADARGELDGLEPVLRAAYLERAGEGETVWVAVGGPRSALVATRDLLYHLAVVRRDVPPEINAIKLRDIRSVETLLGPSRTGVRVVLQSGEQYLAWVAREHNEQAMQAATVMNLLAAEARAHRPLSAD